MRGTNVYWWLTCLSFPLHVKEKGDSQEEINLGRVRTTGGKGKSFYFCRGRFPSLCLVVHPPRISSTLSLVFFFAYQRVFFRPEHYSYGHTWISFSFTPGGKEIRSSVCHKKEMLTEAWKQDSQGKPRPAGLPHPLNFLFSLTVSLPLFSFLSFKRKRRVNGKRFESAGGWGAWEDTPKAMKENDRMLVRTAIFFHNVITTKVLER